MTSAAFVLMGTFAPDAFAIWGLKKRSDGYREIRINHEGIGGKAKRTGLGIGAGTGMAIMGAIIGLKASFAFSVVVGGLVGVAQVGMGNTPDEWWLVNGIADPVFKSFEHQVPEIIRAGAAGFASTLAAGTAIGGGLGGLIGAAVGASKR